MLFVTKGKKKKFAETELLPTDEESPHMNALRANFVSCGGANCVNQYFEKNLLKALSRNRIIWTHYQMLVKALITLSVIRKMKRKVFALHLI